MPAPLNTICLTLLEATLTLYPANALGEPMLDQPLWFGVAAHELNIRDRWLKRETRPSGAKYPRRHPLVPQYEISIERLWALPLAQLEGFLPARRQYVMDIVWRDEDSRDWHRQVYYGVTIDERSRGARGRDGEFIENLSFHAEYHTPPTTGRGTPPAVPPTLRYTVRYVSGSENLEMYSYDPDTDLFTVVAAGVTTNRATLVYTPDHSGEFAVQFAGDDVAALQVAEGKVRVFAVRVGSPTLADLPRVEFWYGPYRVGAVTRSGVLHATSYLALDPLEGNKFQIYSGGNLSFTLDATAATGNFVMFDPALVSGLKLWARVESLGLVERDVDVWPDESGNGHDLAGGEVLTSDEGDALTTEEGQALYGDGTGVPPRLLLNPAQDAWTLHSLPVTGPAVRLTRETLLQTVGPIFNPDAHCLFVVARPYGPGSGVLVPQTLLNSAPAGDNQVQLVLRDDQKLQARFIKDFGGPVDNEAVSGTLGSYIQLIGWHLFEQEGVARTLTPDIASMGLEAGTLPGDIYHYVITDVLPTGELSPSQVATFNLTGGGGLFAIRLNLPAATSGATERRIYRNKVSGVNEYFLLATVAPATTEYDDNVAMATFAATNPAALAAPPRAGHLKLWIDGVEVAAVSDLVGLATGVTQSIQLGAESGGFWGEVKAVLVYEGIPSDGTRAQIRRFLNNAYRIY